jgi:S1-C subfamily serine protease
MRTRPLVPLALLLTLLAPLTLPAQTAQLAPKAAPAAPPPGLATANTLEELSHAVVALSAEIDPSSRTAAVLGTHREGNGAVIDRDGRVLTIGYLILEANEVHVTRYDGRDFPARVLGYDEASGLALLQTQVPLGVEPLALAESKGLAVQSPVLMLTGKGLQEAGAAQVVSRRTFAGYWEYLLEDAIFTAPAQGNYAGAALLDQELRLVGIGSLFVQNAAGEDVPLPGNMFVPVDQVRPVLRDLVETGRPRTRPRPWLGVNVAEQFGRVIVTRVTSRSPASTAGLKPGDIILQVAGHKIEGIESFYRQLWASGAAGVKVPLVLLQRSDVVHIAVPSQDRYGHYGMVPRQ